MYCGEHIAVKSRHTEQCARKLVCRAWTCPDCGPVRRAGLIAQAHRGRPDTFLTVTCRRDLVATAEEAAAELAHAWRVVRLRALREARRDINRYKAPRGLAPAAGWKRDAQGRVPRQVRLYGRTLPFIAVFEEHKSGWPHLHVLARSLWIDHAWLSAQMLDLLCSPVVSVERITARSRVNAYVAKYCGKDSRKFGTSKRYWTSKDFEVVPRKTRPPVCDWPGAWERENTPINRWVADRERLDWKVEWLDGRHALARAPPGW